MATKLARIPTGRSDGSWSALLDRVYGTMISLVKTRLLRFNARSTISML